VSHEKEGAAKEAAAPVGPVFPIFAFAFSARSTAGLPRAETRPVVDRTVRASALGRAEGQGEPQRCGPRPLLASPAVRSETALPAGSTLRPDNQASIPAGLPAVPVFKDGKEHGKDLYSSREQTDISDGRADA
jgi:hypothetical protein